MKRASRAEICSFLFVLVLGVASGSYGQAANGTAPVQKCADLVNLKIPGSTMVITNGEAVPTAAAGTVRLPMSPSAISVSVPSYCRADGEIDQRTGVDGKSYAIGFTIALPDNWNGRFLFQGGEGLNGSVGAPYGSKQREMFRVWRAALRLSRQTRGTRAPCSILLS